MSSQRIPLANNPNAVNSPYRSALASKRAREHGIDLEKDNSPPKKRQMLTRDTATYRRAQKISLNEPEGKVFTERRPHAPQQTLFQQRLLAAQQDRQGTTATGGEKSGQKQLAPEIEQINHWRRHYRRVFPGFVIYFDNLSADVALQLKRSVLKLGGRQADFFSKDVTHIITTRAAPSGSSESNTRDPQNTIDPSVLSKTTGKQTLKVPQQRTAPSSQEPTSKLAVEARSANANDVLQKAQNLGIRIWSLEKFERMLTVIFSAESSVEEDHNRKERTTSTSLRTVPLKRNRDDNLSQLLRNERNNAGVERKPWQEIIPFKGPFIYIHDMDEKVKPVMVREYPVPARKEDGDWPMLRSVSKGRCPFIEEPRQEEKRAELRRAPPKNTEAPPPCLTRAHTAPKPETQFEGRRTRSTTRSPQKTALGEAQTNHIIRPSMPTAKSFEAPPVQRANSGSTECMPPLLGSTHANFNGIPRKPGGEPLASGMQKDVTSAIRSQMFSSTAPAGPGARVGMSKQQHQMSRRVLERQSGLSANSNNSVPSSYSFNEVRAAINNDQAPTLRRSARQKTAEPMARIYEDNEAEEKAPAQRQKTVVVKKKDTPKHDPKPGYCENCRDKYDDFHEHITSKKHRKFATSDENWVELDQLLAKLVRV